MLAHAAPAASTDADLVLTAQQLHHFDIFGFLKLPGLIAHRIAEVIEDFERLWREHGGGHNGRPHDEKQRSCIYPFIDQDARLSSLLDDPGIHGLASSLLGEDFNYIGSDGNFYASDTVWHPDGNRISPRYVKIAIYLDTLDGNSGALRVVPGSHRVGEPYASAVRESVPASMDRLGVHGSHVPAIMLDTVPGDVLVFNHNLLHASFHGSERRRMFTLNLCQHHTDEQIGELQNYLSNHARFLINRNVGPAMLAGAGPQRQRHLDQVLANDFGIAERLPEFLRTRSEPSRG